VLVTSYKFIVSILIHTFSGLNVTWFYVHAIFKIKKQIEAFCIHSLFCR